jgi:hypothetical protein
LGLIGTNIALETMENCLPKVLKQIDRLCICIGGSQCGKVSNMAQRRRYILLMNSSTSLTFFFEEIDY